MKAVLILLSGVLFFSCQRQQKETAPPAGTAAAAEELCFLKIIEGKSMRDGKEIAIRDSMYLYINKKGNAVSGSFKWLPYEKDKKTGTFEGTLKGNTAHTIYAYQSEGVQEKEEFRFTLEKDEASIKFGDMQKDADGIWKYKDTLALSTQALPKAECK